MNVLSIDFDYFQNVTKDVLYAYPDGVDNNTELSEFVWGGIYGGINADKIKKVTIRKDEINLMKQIFSNQKKQMPVMITNSHKHIYDFIHQYADTNEPLRLINIDMHHDMFNDNAEREIPVLDCGNWVTFIVNEYKTDFTWIANPVSSEIFGLDKIDTEENIDRMIPLSVNCIKNMQFDAIFMCRSDTWTPPHLDRYFSELCGCLLKKFGEVYAEKNIFEPRKDVYAIATENRKAMKQVLSEFKSNKQHNLVTKKE